MPAIAASQRSLGIVQSSLLCGQWSNFLLPSVDSLSVHLYKYLEKNGLGKQVKVFRPRLTLDKPAKLDKSVSLDKPAKSVRIAIIHKKK